MIFVSVSGSQRNQREFDKKRQREMERGREKEKKYKTGIHVYVMYFWENLIFVLTRMKIELFYVLPLSDCLC